MNKRDIWIVFGAVAAALALGLSQFFYSAVQTGSWGLHFGASGQPPQGPQSAEKLAAYDAYFVGDTREKVLYLTFDAGYENGCTAKILEVLKKHDAPAAFFLVGNYLEKNADLVRQMVEAGHVVGNHTVSHPDMSAITDPAAFQAELAGVEQRFLEITGKELPKFYRPPQGVYSSKNLENAKNLGYKTIFWSLAYADWDNQNQPQPEAALQKLLGRTHNGAVVLLHATSETNAQILDDLLTAWEAQGYRFGALTELTG